MLPSATEGWSNPVASLSLIGICHITSASKFLFSKRHAGLGIEPRECCYSCQSGELRSTRDTRRRAESSRWGGHSRYPPNVSQGPNHSWGVSTIFAISRYRQRAFASCIWRGLRQSGSSSFGLPTKITLDIARDVATFNRFRLYRNSIPRGASSGDDVVSE
jgi:hypothetical protein